MKRHEKLEFDYIKSKYFLNHNKNTSHDFLNDYKDFLSGNINNQKYKDILKYRAEYKFKQSFESLGVTNVDVSEYVEDLFSNIRSKYENEPILLVYDGIDNDIVKKIKFSFSCLNDKLIRYVSNDCVFTYLAHNSKNLNSDNFRYYVEYLSSDVQSIDNFVQKLFDKLSSILGHSNFMIELNDITKFNSDDKESMCFREGFFKL